MQGTPEDWVATHLLMQSLVQFYLDDLEDELTITALRLLVKDLLVLFQACNEGVINLLGSIAFTTCIIPS